MGVTFRTFGVEHNELKENTVQYKKENVKVSNFIINKTCHMGHFSWNEKTYRNSINLYIR